MRSQRNLVTDAFASLWSNVTEYTASCMMKLIFSSDNVRNGIGALRINLQNKTKILKHTKILK